jgi:hypothetical protein
MIVMGPARHGLRTDGRTPTLEQARAGFQMHWEALKIFPYSGTDYRFGDYLPEPATSAPQQIRRRALNPKSPSLGFFFAPP